MYLISSLRSAIRRHNTSPSLLATHIRLLIRHTELELLSPAKIVLICRKYTTKAPKAAHVWLGRLQAEKEFGTVANEGRSNLDKAWAEARKSAEGPEEELEQVWTWGLFPEDNAEDRRRTHEVSGGNSMPRSSVNGNIYIQGLLRESMRDSSLHGVHEKLLMRYVAVMHEALPNAAAGLTSDQGVTVRASWLCSIRHMNKSYLTSGKVWKTVFMAVESEEDGWGYDVLGEIYEGWRREDAVEATLAWAGWQVKKGKGKEARELVMRMRHCVGEEGRIKMEQGWIEGLERGKWE